MDSCFLPGSFPTRLRSSFGWPLLCSRLGMAAAPWTEEPEEKEVPREEGSEPGLAMVLVFCLKIGRFKQKESTKQQSMAIAESDGCAVFGLLLGLWLSM